jgi:hypothetical protein
MSLQESPEANRSAKIGLFPPTVSDTKDSPTVSDTKDSPKDPKIPFGIRRLASNSVAKSYTSIFIQLFVFVTYYRVKCMGRESNRRGNLICGTGGIYHNVTS